jgi:nicotinate dehydrogenase subunit B
VAYERFGDRLTTCRKVNTQQSDGGIVQVVSQMLVEQSRYSKTSVTSTDFVSYPILRFKDSPKVTSIVLQRSGDQPQGAGQETAVVAHAATANAFFDAPRVRTRTAPLTPRACERH